MRPWPRSRASTALTYPSFDARPQPITGDRELACDAVQDAFARAVRRRAGFRSEGSLNGWIWRIVINTTLRQTRISAGTVGAILHTARANMRRRLEEST